MSKNQQKSLFFDLSTLFFFLLITLGLIGTALGDFADESSFNQAFSTIYSSPEIKLAVEDHPCPKNTERYSLPIEGEISRVDKFFSPYQKFSALFSIDKAGAQGNYVVIGTYSSELHFTNNNKINVPKSGFEWLFLAFFDKYGEFYTGFPMSENKFWVMGFKMSDTKQVAILGNILDSINIFETYSDGTPSNRTFSGMIQNNINSGMLVIYNYGDEKNNMFNVIQEAWVASSTYHLNFQALSIYDAHFNDFILASALFNSNFTFNVFGKDPQPTYTFSYAIPDTGLNSGLVVKRKGVFNFVFFACGDKCEIYCQSLSVVGPSTAMVLLDIKETNANRTVDVTMIDVTAGGFAKNKVILTFQRNFRRAVVLLQLNFDDSNASDPQKFFVTVNWMKKATSGIGASRIDKLKMASSKTMTALSGIVVGKMCFDPDSDKPLCISSQTPGVYQAEFYMMIGDIRFPNASILFMNYTGETFIYALAASKIQDALYIGYALTAESFEVHTEHNTKFLEKIDKTGKVLWGDHLDSATAHLFRMQDIIVDDEDSILITAIIDGKVSFFDTNPTNTFEITTLDDASVRKKETIRSAVLRIVGSYAPFQNVTQDCKDKEYLFIPKCFGKFATETLSCLKNGKCTQYRTCSCYPGYSGQDCADTTCFGISSENSTTCSSNGKCIDKDWCLCNSGYTGDKCEGFNCFGYSDHWGCSRSACPTCTCMGPNRCNCEYPFYGERCEMKATVDPRLQVCSVGYPLTAPGGFATPVKTVKIENSTKWANDLEKMVDTFVDENSANQTYNAKNEFPEETCIWTITATEEGSAQVEMKTVSTFKTAIRVWKIHVGIDLYEGTTPQEAETISQVYVRAGEAVGASAKSAFTIIVVTSNKRIFVQKRRFINDQISVLDNVVHSQTYLTTEKVEITDVLLNGQTLVLLGAYRGLFNLGECTFTSFQYDGAFFIIYDLKNFVCVSTVNSYIVSPFPIVPFRVEVGKRINNLLHVYATLLFQQYAFSGSSLLTSKEDDYAFVILRFDIPDDLKNPVIGNQRTVFSFKKQITNERGNFFFLDFESDLSVDHVENIYVSITCEHQMWVKNARSGGSSNRVVTTMVKIFNSNLHKLNDFDLSQADPSINVWSYGVTVDKNLHALTIMGYAQGTGVLQLKNLISPKFSEDMFAADPYLQIAKYPKVEDSYPILGELADQISDPNNNTVFQFTNPYSVQYSDTYMFIMNFDSNRLFESMVYAAVFNDSQVFGLATEISPRNPLKIFKKCLLFNAVTNLVLLTPALPLKTRITEILPDPPHTKMIDLYPYTSKERDSMLKYPQIDILRSTYCSDVCPLGTENDKKVVDNPFVKFDPLLDSKQLWRHPRLFCRPCQPGYFKQTATANCVQCPKGQFQSGYGALQCDPCEIGYYADVVGLAKCHLCPEIFRGFHMTLTVGNSSVFSCYFIYLIIGLFVAFFGVFFISICLCTGICGFFICCVAPALYIFVQKTTKKKSFNEALEMLLNDDHSIDSRKDAKKKEDPFHFEEGMFEIKFNSIKLVKEIGSGGGGGIVFKAKLYGETVAVKIFKASVISNNPSEFQNEISLLGSLRHKHVVSFYGAFYEPPKVGWVCEFCPHGTLVNLMKAEFKKRSSDDSYVNAGYDPNNIRDPKLSDYINFLHANLSKKLKIMYGVAKGMNFLHNRGVIHRDLKCENILLTDADVPKISDFGTSKIVHDQKHMTQLIGTAITMAPEVVLGLSYDGKVDVFAFGIILYQFIFNKLEPYADNEQQQAGAPSTEDNEKQHFANIEYKVATNENYRPIIPPEAIDHPDFRDLVSIMKKCWSQKPAERPTFAIICSELKRLLLKYKKQQPVKDDD